MQGDHNQPFILVMQVLALLLIQVMRSSVAAPSAEGLHPLTEPDQPPGAPCAST
jgi:hypothetical protein